MFDEHSQRMIEECLIAAEGAMKRASIGVMRTAIDKPHGFTLLVHFDEQFRYARVYRPRHGMAPFRTFIRATPNTPEYDKQAFELLLRLKKLERFYRPFLIDPDIDIPEVKRSYVNELRFYDITAWPDELYYNLIFKADELFGSSYVPPKIVDLSEISPKELELVPGHLKYENAVKNAIDLVCMGPWAGISVPKIIQALDKLYDDLSHDKHVVEPPILQCLEPKTTGRLTIPLWRAGRFHGVFSVIMGGPMEQLEPLEGLVAECNSVSHLLFSILQRERERRARTVLNSGLTDRDRPITETIGEAAHILAAPHHVRGVAATDGGRHGSGAGFGYGEADGPPLRFSIEETVFDQPFRIDVELFDEKRQIIRDLMKIYIANELRRINSELKAQSVATESDGPDAGTFPQSRSEIEEVADHTLQINKNDSRLPNKEYCLCFVSLAILKQRDAPVVKISGSRNYAYQRELARQYGIRRKQAANPGRNPGAKAAEGQDGVYLSHLCTEAALKFVRQKFPGLDITREHNLVEICFKNG